MDLGTTESTAEDVGAAYRWAIGDSVGRSTDGGTTYTTLASAHIPRFSVVGHTTETLRILAADIVSEPYNGTAYAAGEHIEARIILNGPVRAPRNAPDGPDPTWRGSRKPPRRQVGQHPWGL